MKYLACLTLILLITGCGTSSEPIESGRASENKDHVASEALSENENKNMEEYAQFEGIVAKKFNAGKENRILVVPNMDKQKVHQQNNKSHETTLRIYEMESFQKVKKKSLLVVNDPEVIDIAEKTISTAEKVPGIVDVADPEYQLEIKGETYFLWSREESATIMNAEETNNVYTVQLKQAKQVHEFLKAKGFTG